MSITIRAFASFPWTSAFFSSTEQTQRYNSRLVALKQAGTITGPKGRAPERASTFFAALLPPEVAAWFQDATVIPLPGHSAKAPQDVLNTKLFAEDLVKRNPASQLSLSIERVVSVSQSSKVKASDRPTVAAHLSSLRLLAVPRTSRVVLVDDIITRGCLAAACGQLLRQANYRGDLYMVAGGFTRTMQTGMEEDPELLVTWMPGDTHPTTSRTGTFFPF